MKRRRKKAARLAIPSGDQSKALDKTMREALPGQTYSYMKRKKL